MNCTRDPGAPIGIYPLRKVRPKVLVKAKAKAKDVKKRQSPASDEDEEEIGSKRKAGGKAKTTGEMFSPFWWKRSCTDYGCCYSSEEEETIMISLCVSYQCWLCMFSWFSHSVICC